MTDDEGISDMHPIDEKLNHISQEVPPRGPANYTHFEKPEPPEDWESSVTLDPLRDEYVEILGWSTDASGHRVYRGADGEWYSGPIYVRRSRGRNAGLIALPTRLRSMGLEACNEAADEIERLRAALMECHNLSLLPFDDNKRRAIGIAARKALADG